MLGISWNIVALLVLTLAVSTTRAEAPRIYLSGGIGAGYAPNGALDGLGATVDFDLGRPITALALGMELRRGWRFEVDAGYRHNDAEVVFFDAGAPDFQPDVDSRITALSLTANALYEFDLGRAFRPYLGWGIGVARVDYEISEFITQLRLLDDTDNATAYQLIAGFSLDLTPRLDLLIDYRYWRAPGVRLEDVAGESLEVDHEIHSAMLNLRFRPAARVARARTGAAERRQGWYLHSNAGMSFAKDAEIKDNLANFDAFDIGTVAAVALGRTVAERWRIELEGARRSNEVELIDFNPEFGEERAEGRVAVRSVMANLAYEPDWNTAFRPYAGLGVGMAWSKWDVRLEADNSTYVDDQDSAPAFQVMFGAAADLTERLEATAEYRYWMTGLFDLAEPDGRPMRTEHTVHSVMFGLRYTLR